MNRAEIDMNTPMETENGHFQFSTNPGVPITLTPNQVLEHLQSGQQIDFVHDGSTNPPRILSMDSDILRQQSSLPNLGTSPSAFFNDKRDPSIALDNSTPLPELAFYLALLFGLTLIAYLIYRNYSNNAANPETNTVQQQTTNVVKNENILDSSENRDSLGLPDLATNNSPGLS